MKKRDTTAVFGFGSFLFHGYKFVDMEINNLSLNVRITLLLLQLAYHFQPDDKDPWFQLQDLMKMQQPTD